MAERGDLPGLHPQLRGRQRRRHRRPRRRPRPGWTTWPTWASTRSGSPRGTRRRWTTAATTSPTSATSSRSFGTLAEAEDLIAEAHACGIRVIIDIVPNHCSDEHRWFQAALEAGPGSPERQRFWFRPGRGPDGERAAEQLEVALRRVRVDPRAATASGTCTSTAPRQPDFNWDNPEIRTEFEDVLRFWFDRGVDGFRIDVADGLVKDPRPARRRRAATRSAVLRHGRACTRSTGRWRKIADSYAGRSVLVGEMWLPGPVARPRATCAATSCTRRSTSTSCPARGTRRASATSSTRRCRRTTRSARRPTWVLSNHDVTRHVTRYGRQGDTAFGFATGCTSCRSTSSWAPGGRGRRRC